MRRVSIREHCLNFIVETVGCKEQITRTTALPDLEIALLVLYASRLTGGGSLASEAVDAGPGTTFTLEATVCDARFSVELGRAVGTITDVVEGAARETMRMSGTRAGLNKDGSPCMPCRGQRRPTTKDAMYDLQ